MSPGWFKAILRYQLLRAETQFWQALDMRSPVDR